LVFAKRHAGGAMPPGHWYHSCLGFDLTAPQRFSSGVQSRSSTARLAEAKHACWQKLIAKGHELGRKA
jgi:hypothetical protein